MLGTIGQRNDLYVFTNPVVTITLRDPRLNHPQDLAHQQNQNRHNHRQDRVPMYINNEVPPSFEQQFVNHLLQQYQRQSQNTRNKRKATDKRELKQMPVYTCDTMCPYQLKFEDCNQQCAVCISDSEDGEKLMCLPCSHVFHEECLIPWLTTHNSCPVCRFELEVSDLQLEKDRKLRMKRQYGMMNINLMTIYTQVQRSYCLYQRWKTNPKKAPMSLKKIKQRLEVKRAQLFSLEVPDEDPVHSREDWHHIRQTRTQLIDRVEYLIELVEEAKEQTPHDPSKKKRLVFLKRWGNKVLHTFKGSTKE